MKFRAKQLLKMVSQHVIFPLVYFANRWRKVEPDLVVFADAHHENCPEQMKLLAKVLMKQGYRVRFFFFDEKVCGNWRAYFNMLSFMAIYASCSVVVICDNFLPVSSCRKKRETKVIQLWHGCGAFKRFGYDSEEDIPAGYYGHIYRNYDLVTVSGKKCIPVFQRAMGLSKGVVCATGCSITDRMYSEKYKKRCRERFLQNYPEAAGKKVVLWAPTFRGNAGLAELVGEEFIDHLSQDERIREKYYVVKSIHPHLFKRKPSMTMGEMSATMEKMSMTTEELMYSADVMITDYSSVFFEYLLLDKPLIFFAPDYERYCGKRGFYLDYEKLPGIVVTGDADTVKRNVNAVKGAGGKKLEETLYEKLVSALENTEADEKQDCRRKFCEQYMEACDGRATRRVMAYIQKTRNNK